eukprot:CAMPEP_0172622628 /NCGR_PEP_ID=MMETSP1068-20121228/121881_1 /TAXON_ID=35684 /ORGANISM="Pseudopedinella elastica, Strain CCMP716" /LENGTH=142 /DNA_ID=CAMNT_0013430851 /DNA_START=1 /DNA_END=429 /DNA_ORIENTATION=+
MRESIVPSSEDESVDDEHKPIVCCLYKSHVEFILFHLFTCGKHLCKKGPAYKALRMDYDDSDDEFGMASEEEDESEDEEERERNEARRKRIERRERAAKERRRVAFEAQEVKARPHTDAAAPSRAAIKGAEVNKTRQQGKPS